MVKIKPSGPLRITVLFEAAVTDYLWIEPQIAGRWWAVEDDAGVAVRFPSSDPEADLDIVQAYPAERMDEAGRRVGLGAALIEARVDIPATVSQWETHAHILLAKGRASRAVAKFLAWCKVRQPWIGAYDSSPEPLEVLVASTETGEAYTDQTERARRRREGPQVRGIDEPSLLASDVEEFIRRASRGELPEPAFAFLADAYFAVFCADPPDVKRAVLLAAFACEIRIRQALDEHARPDTRAQFEKWFPPEGQPKRPVPAWTGAVAKALVGRSLQEEDGDLFRGVRELVATRNTLAHQGTSPEHEAAVDAVRTSRRLFRWLDSW